MRGKKIAAGLAAALLLGFAAMLAFTVADKARWTTLETVSEPRGVGDHGFFPVPPNLVRGQALAKMDGHTLTARDTEWIEYRDSRMVKLNLDDTGAFYIYRSLEPADVGLYFLKAANGKYVKTVMNDQTGGKVGK